MRCSAKHDRISVISCVTLNPKAMHVGLYSWSCSNRNVHGEEVFPIGTLETGNDEWRMSPFWALGANLAIWSMSNPCACGSSSTVSALE